MSCAFVRKDMNPFKHICLTLPVDPARTNICTFKIPCSPCEFLADFEIVNLAAEGANHLFKHLLILLLFVH